MDSRPPKRVKTSSEKNVTISALQLGLPGQRVDPASIRERRTAFLSSVSRSISPPPSRSSTPTRQATESITAPVPAVAPKHKPVAEAPPRVSKHEATGTDPTTEVDIGSQVKLVASPFQLTKIRGLQPSKNLDTISLPSILGNPLIKEAWIFNYCFDVDWLMGFFDSDVRAQVKVKVIHGSWKNDDPKKIAIDDACQRWNNVEAATAYLPDQFGTHHSKMFVLFTHDDQAQVIIHTANMLAQDWSNLTQAAWVSPSLPLLKGNQKTVIGKIGSGSRFKHDLLDYLKAYGSKAKSLREQLTQFDFSSVRGALIASVPAHMKGFPVTMNMDTVWDQKLFGYPSLLRTLQSVLPSQRMKSSLHTVCQVSSIATLPQKWLDQFAPVLYDPSSSTQSPQQHWDPSRVSIIYPTSRNVASSLDGYASGGSIHTKAQSPTHLKQIDNLRASLCQWTQGPQKDLRAGRNEAAPHIKTYVCFSAKPSKEQPMPDIEWALLTSANLSQQAWGTLRESGKGKQKEKEIVVQSYEIGVLVWPGLFEEGFDTGEGEGTGEIETKTTAQRDTESVRMVPVFGKSTPSESETATATEQSGSKAQTNTVVGLRLPYDLPLTPYSNTDMPWSMQGIYEQPDRFGRRWPRDFI